MKTLFLKLFSVLVLAFPGTATLTVYMIPYFFIGIWILVTPALPAWYSGWTGVAFSVAYAGVCIGITALLGKVGIKLKI